MAEGVKSSHSDEHCDGDIKLVGIGKDNKPLCFIGKEVLLLAYFF